MRFPAGRPLEVVGLCSFSVLEQIVSAWSPACCLGLLINLNGG